MAVVPGFERGLIGQQLKSGDAFTEPTRPISIQPKKKDFWTDQISTGGGIGGSLAGAATGAAIGSVVPGVGTVIGGLAGGILGGALGSGGGELVENAVTGDDLWKNVGQEALLGGAFSAPPVRLARGIGAAGKALVGKGAEDSAKAAFETAFTAPGTLSKIGSTLRGEARGVGIGEKVNGARIGPEKTGEINKFLENTVKVKGLTAAKQLESLESFIKSRGDALSGAITSSNRQLTAQEKEAITKSLTKDFTSSVISPTSRQQAIFSDIATRIGQSKSIQELDSLRKVIDDNINFARNASSPEPAAEQVYKMARRLLTDSVADRVGAAKGLKGDLSKAFEAQDLLLNKAGSGGGIARTNGTSIASIPIPERVSQGAQTLAGRTLGKIGGGQGTGMTLGPIAGRQIAGELLQQSSNSQPGLEDTLLQAQAAPQETLLAGQSIDGFNQTGLQQDQSPYTRENLTYDLQRDPKNADKYIQYYQQLQEVYGPQSANLSQSNQSALASADNATNTLSQLEGLYGAAGGGSGRVLGALQNLAGTAGIDKNASVYNSLAQASVTQIAKALAGSGAGTVSDADARVIVAALPTLQDSPEEAQAKFSALKQRLAAARQNTLNYGSGGSSSLTDILLSQGGYQ